MRYTKIIRDKIDIFIKKWLDSGTFLTGHLIITDGKFMSFGEDKRKCQVITNTNLLMYEGVLKALSEYQRAKEIVLTDCSKQYQTKAWIDFLLKKEIKLFSP